jgi:hypothetical protein
VMNEAIAFHRPAIVQGGMDRTLLHAHFATDLVAMQQDAIDAGMAQHIDSRIAGDPLGAFAPKNDVPLHIQHADADLQMVENFAVNMGILECRHTAAQKVIAVCTSAKKDQNLRIRVQLRLANAGFRNVAG